jgi:hypothetical protein
MGGKYLVLAHRRPDAAVGYPRTANGAQAI